MLYSKIEFFIKIIIFALENIGSVYSTEINQWYQKLFYNL